MQRSRSPQYACGGALLAVSDLHVEHSENRRLVESLRPRADGDWLIVAGDVADDVAAVDWALGLLAERFTQVVWVPGNHELLAWPGDELRGQRRYERLVELCRSRGVATPEDPYLVWHGRGGPATIVPLFLLYDYSFGGSLARTKAAALRRAHAAGVVCVDEHLLDPDPYPSREAWCAARVARSEQQLAAVDGSMPTVLVNHFPLIREPTFLLRHREFAQWCGTERTADWHRRYRAKTVVYGHLHIPRTSYHDGVRFEEVSVGYPRERAARPPLDGVPRQILPAPVVT